MKTRKEYHEEMELLLRNIRLEIDALKLKLERKVREGMEPYEEGVDNLTKKHEAARQKLEELRAADDGEWETVKEGWEELRDDLQKTLNDFVSSF